MAAEIRMHDWSDAPYRIDRAGHQRGSDTNRGRDVLSAPEAESVRINTMWVTAQVLGHNDPTFDVLAYAGACGVAAIKSGGWIKAGIRTTNGRYNPPGTLHASASDLLPRCHVCAVTIEPDQNGLIRREGVADADGRLLWGMVWVHTYCRFNVSTPYDDKLGSGLEAVWDHVKV